MRRHVLAASLAGIVLLVVACSLPNVGLWDGKGVGDTGLYGQYGQRMATGLVPYRDFYIEFPPGALPALVVPDLVSHRHYVAAFHGYELTCAALCLALVAWTLAGIGASPRRIYGATALVALFPVALGKITLNSFDLWPALLTTAAVALALRRRHLLAGAALGLATAAKIFPAALVPLLLLDVWRTTRSRGALRRVAAAYVGAGAAVTLPFLALAPGGLGFSLETQAKRALQVESLGASIVVTLHHLGAVGARVVVGKPYSLDLAGTLPDALAALTTVASIAAVLLPLWLVARGPQTRERVAVAVAASVTGLVVLGRVLSPQYLIWLVPLAALVEPRRALRAWPLLAAALVLTQAWFPSRFWDVVHLGGAGWLVLARNLVLLAAYASLLAALRPVRGESTVDRAPAPWRRADQPSQAASAA